MKKLYWFTHTNIDCGQRKDFTFDLSPYLKTFIEHSLWQKIKYRTEYSSDFTEDDLKKIISLKINIHTKNSPFSNCHEYESVLKNYFELNDLEKLKLAQSGISDASRIAVIEVEFQSDTIIRQNLTYEEEKDYEKVFEQLDKSNHHAWEESNKIKSATSEIVQFFLFNLHLCFSTHNYSFSFTDKPNLTGFSIIKDDTRLFYETDKIEFFSHYILIEEDIKLYQLMSKTSEFWCKDITSIQFFLDALKSNFVTSTNFIKLVFTLETFFSKNTSNDYVSLVLPLLLCDKIRDMKEIRNIVRKSFSLRNEIVHGNTLFDFNFGSTPFSSDIKNDELFYKLKNLIIQIFYFYINNDLFVRTHKTNLSHELMFEFFPSGIRRKN